ncbi:MAG: UDP-N-acetylmuramate--L-alanine ligase [Proteobacteria bacterium]|nr:UDP-N-acetylmuramate--L-alanine ligase [Pseudomonadota bacterium]MCP4916087.1 UDP-N-acetylmuramate--L-alanine ligase [Pseudomonadota bacterium]
MFRGKVRQIHFIGIGGSGMNGIAEVLLNLGFSVSGSDLRVSANVRRLRKLGAVVHIGHAPENLGDADVVVRSTAVGSENAEVRAAIARHTPVIPRAEMLAELMRMKYGVAVAGTHGKTTSTSMLAKILGEGGLDPTIVIGGKLDAIGSNARLGKGDFLVAEADESDGSFMYLAPTVAVITNVDPEHLDHYGDFETLKDTFVAFANKVPFFGFAVVCLDHPVVQDLLPRLKRRLITYGLSRQAEVRAGEVIADGLTTRFTVLHKDVELGEVTMAMPGRHNVQNALAAIATALELDIPFAQIQAALNGFTGVQRRFTVRGDVGGVLIVDDYGHHPVEIEATLQGARDGFPDRRIVAVFQPHRYSRVQDLELDFCRAFNRADHVLVCPIYTAGEAPVEGLDSHRLADGLRSHGHRSVHAVDDLDEALTHLREITAEGDLVLTLGAGNVNTLCERLGEALA